MTIDRTSLRRLWELVAEDGDVNNPFRVTLIGSIPSLLDEIDRLERNLRGTDDTLDVVRKASMERGLRADDLGIRLHVATELNVGDRKRIVELETELGEAKLVLEQQDRDLEKLRAALGEAIDWIADRSSPDSILVERLMKVLG